MVATLILMISGRGIAQLITNGLRVQITYRPYSLICWVVMEWRAGRRQKQKRAILGQVGTGSLLQPHPKKKGPTGPFTAMA